VVEIRMGFNHTMLVSFQEAKPWKVSRPHNFDGFGRRRVNQH
jgi:hypothetical protein